MPFSQAPLPYPYTALEPHVDARTMEIHYSKHHATYIANLNKALESASALQAKSIDELLASLDTVPESIRTAVRNNGGGHANHTLFWQLMAPNAGETKPSSDLAAAIDKSLGGLAKLKEQFAQAGMTRFGSGWAWLIAAKDGSLSVSSTPNQDTPIMDGKRPILGLDVWEHAYYLLYQNRRADYINAWWNVVNWTKVSELFQAATR